MQVLSSLSGITFYAPSAGFAPTNSADVSAIASAYQVVSSTATQLYAGSSYVTEVNGAPLSASRAGQAANASLANSAYYDGAGRLISSLPDGGEVSAIASSYAESAASGKQDTIEFGYDANNLISSIDGSALAGQGGGGGSVASPSGTIIVTDGTAIEATNSAIGQVQRPPVVIASGTAATYSIYTYQGYTDIEYARERACGVGITFYSGSECNLTFLANTEAGLLTASAHCETVDTSAYVIFSGTPLTIYHTMASASGQSVSLSGANPVLYLETGGTVDGVQELAWASALPTYEYDGDGKISAIDGSALAGGGGGGGVVTSVSSYSGYATAINESSIMTVPSAHAYYTSTALILKSTSQFNNRYVSQYIDSSTLYTPPAGCNSVLISGLANGNIYYSASATLVNGTTASASYGLSEYSGLFTASAQISAMRLLTRSLGNTYYRTAYLSAGNYRPSGDAIIPLISTADLDVAVLKTDAQIALNGAYADANSLAIGTGAKAYEASIAIGNAYNTATAESIAVGYNNSAAFYGYAVGVSNTASGSAMSHGYANGASGQSLSVGAYNSSQSASVSIGAYNTARTTSVAMGSDNTASQASLVQGIQNSGYWNSLAVGSSNNAGSRSLAVGVSSTADKTALAQGRACYASGNSFAQGSFNSATDYSFAQGYGLSAANTLAAFGTYNKSGDGEGATGAAFVIGDGTAEDALHDLMVVTKDGEITMFSGTADTVGTGIMSSIRAISAAATGGGGGVDSATVSAIASAYVESGVSAKLDSSASSSFYTTANESGFITGVDLTDYATTAYVESSVSGKMDSSASSSFYTTANESGFVDSAYVESSVSGKMDASAIDYTRTGGGTQIYASGDGSSTNQFSAKNDSAGAAIIAGENARLRLWDTAATANLYASSIGGWNAAANLVSSQSANWGGSALQLSAGPGVTLTKSGNLLVASTDETVLWSGNLSSTADKITLSEPFENFDAVDIYWRSYGRYYVNRLMGNSRLQFGQVYCDGNYPQITTICYDGSYTGTEYTFNSMYHQAVTAGSNTSTTDFSNIGIKKIVGINRTAEA